MGHLQLVADALQLVDLLLHNVGHAQVVSGRRGLQWDLGVVELVLGDRGPVAALLHSVPAFVVVQCPVGDGEHCLAVALLKEDAVIQVCAGGVGAHGVGHFGPEMLTGFDGLPQVGHQFF